MAFFNSAVTVLQPLVVVALGAGLGIWGAINLLDDFSMRLRHYGIMEVVPMINRPLYVDKIMAYTDTPFVKVLTGVRRCGKSTVLKMIMAIILMG